MDIKQRLSMAAVDLQQLGHLTHADVCRDALSEIEALQKDALRYRWLRDQARWPVSAEAGETAGIRLDNLCDSHMRQPGGDSQS